MYVSYKQDQNLHPNIVEEHDNEQTNNEERPITQSNHEEKYETDEESYENVNKTLTENESEQVFKTSSKDPFKMYNKICRSKNNRAMSGNTLHQLH